MTHEQPQVVSLSVVAAVRTWNERGTNRVVCYPANSGRGSNNFIMKFLRTRIALWITFAVIKVDSEYTMFGTKTAQCAFSILLTGTGPVALCPTEKPSKLTYARCSYHERIHDFGVHCTHPCGQTSCHMDRETDLQGYLLRNCSKDPSFYSCNQNIFKYFKLCQPNCSRIPKNFTKSIMDKYPMSCQYVNTTTDGKTFDTDHLFPCNESKKEDDTREQSFNLAALIAPTVFAVAILFIVVIVAIGVVFRAKLLYKRRAIQIVQGRGIRLSCDEELKHGYKSFSRYHCVVPTWEDRQKNSKETQPSDHIDDLITSTLHKHDGASPECYWEPSDEMDVLVNQMNEASIVEIPTSLLEMSELLGEGQFGEVWKGMWNAPPGCIGVAVKVLKLSAEDGEFEDIKLLSEAAVMAQFKHQNVVRLYGVVTTNEPNMFVMEYLCKGDLRSHLEQLCLRSEQEGLRNYLVGFCQQIANGMSYLSKKGYIHRDLAARNVMLDFSFTCKIADFGLARKASVVDDGDKSGYYFTAGGNIPLKWTAPEAVLERKYSSSSDVWSYGMVLYEIWSLGAKPFSNKDAIDVITSFHQRKDYIQSPPTGCPRKIYKLMILCWNLDHHKRPHFEDILLTLMHPDNEWLEVTSEDASCTSNPESAKRLGEQLKDGLDLYKDLQQYYISDSKAERENKI